MWDSFMFEIEMRLFGNAADRLWLSRLLALASLRVVSKRLKDDKSMFELAIFLIIIMVNTTSAKSRLPQHSRQMPRNNNALAFLGCQTSQ